METETQPTPAVTTGDPDQKTASTGSLPADQEIATSEVGPGSSASTSPETPDALAGQSATATLQSAADPARPDPPTMTPLPDQPPRESPRPASITFLVVVTFISLAADLVTKYYAKSRLSGFDTKSHALHRVEVWKGHLDFIFAQNPGGAWSFLRSLPDTLRRPFFLVVSAAAIVFIISIYRRIGDDQRAMKWGLPLALGGAMGNLVDRMRYGWVVDFIDVYISRKGREHHWPTFNVADIAIVVGVGLMAIDMLWISGRKPRSPDLQPHVSSL
jgi:signal peptidase II